VPYREQMLKFRPRVGPFVWVPGRRSRARVPSMPLITFAVIAIFALACGGLVWALNAAG
jgi:hypothetical protein